MAIGPSVALANAWLADLDGLYVKLHVGDPGAAGTSNAATETTRKIISLATPSGGSTASDADITWTAISGSEDASHFSVWDDPTAGNFQGSGTITAAAYTAGGDYTCPAGSLTFSLTPAS